MTLDDDAPRLAWRADRIAKVLEGNETVPTMRVIEFMREAGPLLRNLAAEIDKLRHENHNLNWVLGTDGYTQMATPEEQAEHEKAHARTMVLIAKFAQQKARTDALVPKGKSVIDTLEAQDALLQQALEALEELVDIASVLEPICMADEGAKGNRIDRAKESAAAIRQHQEQKGEPL